MAARHLLRRKAVARRHGATCERGHTLLLTLQLRAVLPPVDVRVMRNCRKPRSMGHLARRTPPQCEPTIMCEGFTFQLRKLPQPQRTQEVDQGAMFNRIKEVPLHDLQVIRQKIFDTPWSQANISLMNEIREELLLLLEHHGITNCDLHRRLLQLPTFVQGDIHIQVINYLRSSHYRSDAGMLLALH